MCGIYAFIGKPAEPYRHQALKPRGPHSFHSVTDDSCLLAFYRLAIVGIDNGEQPITIGSVSLICNGEIYNYKQLAEKYNLQLTTGSDCEIIIALYLAVGLERTIAEISGEFAFVLVDREKQMYHFARDQFGIKPMYIACGISDEKIDMVELSSELKGMINFAFAQHVNPRVLYTFQNGIMSTSEYTALTCSMSHADNDLVYSTFVNAVVRRINQSEQPVGFMLSGGLDSTAILGVALEYYRNTNRTEPVRVFTFGFDKSAPDVISATAAIEWFRNKYGPNCIDWHLVIEPVETGLNSLAEVIETLETYDTTTIRASTPMYLLSRYISRNTPVVVIISGEGSDELFGGYLYFKYAPNEYAARSEILKLLNNIHYFDVLRADRSTAAHHLEMRPPFLDREFVQSVLSHRNLKPGENTKQLLRDILRDKDIIPNEILNGRKEAFSDAVGLSWKDSIAKYCSEKLEHIDDDISMFQSQHIEPVTAEMKYYQLIYGSKYMFYHMLPTLWLPNQSWVNTGVEPSARALPLY